MKYKNYNIELVTDYVKYKKENPDFQIPITKDNSFKAICKYRKEFMNRIIANMLHLDYELIKNSYFIDTELPKINYKNIDDIKYLKWWYDKLLLNETTFNISTLNPGSICWVDFGQNIGSELRKLRPAILWRSSSDKKMWTVIPLSSKCYNDKYYFHCDISGLSCSTAKLECMSNFSYKRIREPFFYNKKIAHLSKEDYSNVLASLKNITLLEINFNQYIDY